MFTGQILSCSCYANFYIIGHGSVGGPVNLGHIFILLYCLISREIWIQRKVYLCYKEKELISNDMQ